MREILFRGKTEQGKWLYGYLVKGNYNTGFGIIEDHIDTGMQYVKEETVGQFTGLMDKNGAKIFEGDFLKYKLKERINDVYIYGYVVYNQDTCEFVVSSIVEEFIIPDKDFFNDIEDIEVIGNIHDNPELLGE